MSMIRCPECGQEVSSTSEQCVHCGYKFRVCPECGKVVSAESKECPSCGYHFEITRPSVSAQEPSNRKQEYDNFVDEWLAEKPARKLIFSRRTTTVIRVACIVMVVILVVMACNKFSAWGQISDETQKLANASNVRDYILLMIKVMAVIGIFINSYPVIIKVAKNIFCLKWLETKTFDAKQRLIEAANKRGDVLMGQEVETFEDAKTVAYFKAVPKHKILYYVVAVFDILFSVISHIILVAWVNNQFNAFFEAYRAGQEFQFTYTGAIVSLAFGFAAVIVWAVISTVFESKRDKWIGIDGKKKNT